MPLIKPDAAQLEYLKARIVGLAALHREYEMVAFRGQVREMTDNCRRVLAH